MIRSEQIEKAAQKWCDSLKLDHNSWDADCFQVGAEWADMNPRVEPSFENAIGAMKFLGLKDKLAIAIEALEDIANEDYRGNRPSGSVKAYNALKKIEEILK